MPDAKIVYVDPHVTASRADEVVAAVDQARAVVVAVYIVPSAARSRKLGRGGKHPASLPDSTSALFERILARASEKTAVLAMGNPYLTDDFPAIQNYICTFSNVTVSEISAARALFGEIPMSGQMPVNLSSSGVKTQGVSRPAPVATLRLP
jgi:beta-N-acetylhexosaminidase